MDDREAWLGALKPGDKVVLTQGYGVKTESLKDVSSATSTLVRIGTWEFRRADGRKRGGTAWDAPCIIDPPTPERLERIEKWTLAQRLRETKWETLPLEVLQRVARAVKEEP